MSARTFVFVCDTDDIGPGWRLESAPWSEVKGATVVSHDVLDHAHIPGRDFGNADELLALGAMMATYADKPDAGVANVYTTFTAMIIDHMVGKFAIRELPPAPRARMVGPLSDEMRRAVALARTKFHAAMRPDVFFERALAWLYTGARLWRWRNRHQSAEQFREDYRYLISRASAMEMRPGNRMHVTVDGSKLVSIDLTSPFPKIG